ncbi:MAG: hypothetical protein K2Q18_08190, partial [Bdellovibrionales bacterium]|nr:hypothetical protein [Bdellovibrionales bacterium]
PYYYMLYLLDEKGILERDLAVKLFKERFSAPELADIKVSQGMIGPFVSVETLNQFSFALCEELNAEKISLLSVQEYNALLDQGQDANGFHRDLLEKGNVMENIERKKQGFLNRFFT